MPQSRTNRIEIRFYGRLDDFLRNKHKGTFIPYVSSDTPSLMDTVQALGVPHTETGVILCGRKEVDLSYRPMTGERIRVWPVRAPCKTRPAFLLDVHLGRLTRLLRLLGFDTLYRNDYSDTALANLAAETGRIVLTRDVGLLKHKKIRRGYWLRNSDPRLQLEEAAGRYSLKRFIRPFRRCLACNGILKKVSKEAVRDKLLPGTRERHREFRQCGSCRNVYWKGSHYQRLESEAGRYIPHRKSKRVPCDR